MQRQMCDAVLDYGPRDRIRWALLSDGEVSQVLLAAIPSSKTTIGLQGRKVKISYMEALRLQPDFWDAACDAALRIDPSAVMVHGAGVIDHY